MVHVSLVLKYHELRHNCVLGAFVVWSFVEPERPKRGKNGADELQNQEPCWRWWFYKDPFSEENHIESYCLGSNYSRLQEQRAVTPQLIPGRTQGLKFLVMSMLNFLSNSRTSLLISSPTKFSRGCPSNPFSNSSPSPKNGTPLSPLMHSLMPLSELVSQAAALLVLLSASLSKLRATITFFSMKNMMFPGPYVNAGRLCTGLPFFLWRTWCGSWLLLD